jgi:ADP-ribosylglycohydrolase
LTPKTKGVTLPNDHKRSIKRTVARSKTTHKRAKIEAKASMAYLDLVLNNAGEAPYKRIEDVALRHLVDLSHRDDQDYFQVKPKNRGLAGNQIIFL